eukprot:SAG11_NODE_14688_length_603_cov_0.847222_1_plen_172_part_01
MQWSNAGAGDIHDTEWCRDDGNVAPPRAVLQRGAAPRGLAVFGARAALHCTNASQSLIAGLPDYNSNGCPDEWEGDDRCDELYGHCPHATDPDCGPVGDQAACGANGGGGFPCSAVGVAYVALHGDGAASGAGHAIGTVSLAAGELAVADLIGDLTAFSARAAEGGSEGESG